MIHHIAVWVSDLEKMKDFFIKYFNCSSNQMYHNQKTHFKSYFLTFDHGTKIELMEMPEINEMRNCIDKQRLGFAHIAISVGSQEAVDQLTSKMVDDGFILASAPRTTGDGYYESCILDPELNRIEITI